MFPVLPNLTIHIRNVIDLEYKNKVPTNFGNFYQNDIPEKIINPIIKYGFQMLQIKWKTRPDGLQPYDSPVCLEEMGDNYPQILIEFLSKKLFIDDKKEVFELEIQNETSNKMNFLKVQEFDSNINLLPKLFVEVEKKAKKEEIDIRKEDKLMPQENVLEEGFVWVFLPDEY